MVPVPVRYESRGRNSKAKWGIWFLPPGASPRPLRCFSHLFPGYNRISIPCLFDHGCIRPPYDQKQVLPSRQALHTLSRWNNRPCSPSLHPRHIIRKTNRQDISCCQPAPGHYTPSDSPVAVHWTGSSGHSVSPPPHKNHRRQRKCKFPGTDSRFPFWVYRARDYRYPDVIRVWSPPFG